MNISVCKLSELEKQCQEYKQKAVALKLLNRKEKACLEEFEELLTSIQSSRNAILQTMNMQKMREVNTCFPVSVASMHFPCNSDNQCLPIII